MAYALPYPNIVFVPLDVLTAEELNQLVANDESLASKITNVSTNANVINFGGRKLMWGKATVNNVPSHTGRSIKIAFPELFANSPVVNTTCTAWLSMPEIMAINASTSGFELVVAHAGEKNVNIPVSWVAIA